jgi:hypothetical protein
VEMAVEVAVVVVVVTVELCNIEVKIKVMVFHAVTFMFGTEYQTFHNIRSLYQIYHIVKKIINTTIHVYQKHFCVKCYVI